MPLLAIAPPAFDVDLALAYATPDNVCDRPLYARAAAYLHRDAAAAALDMGTAFDDFSPRSRHGDATVSPAAQRNRGLLLDLMRLAGFEHHADEWWHYPLPDAARHPLLGDGALGRDGLMPH